MWCRGRKLQVSVVVKRLLPDEEGKMSSNENETINQLYALLFEVNDICEKHNLISPVNVRVMNADCSFFEFMYDPMSVTIRINVVPLNLPAMVRVTDAGDDFIEKKITELALPEGASLKQCRCREKA